MMNSEALISFKSRQPPEGSRIGMITPMLQTRLFLPKEPKRHRQSHKAGENAEKEKRRGWMRGEEGRATETGADTQIRSAVGGPGARHPVQC